jgi:hypothetical protein
LVQRPANVVFFWKRKILYAREQGLDLDLTTPPKRPDPRESLKRMLEILDRSDVK